MESIKHTLTPAAALAFVRRTRGKGKSLFIACGQAAPIAGQPGYHFPVMGHVPVSHKVAMKFLVDTYSQVMANKGALCVISELDLCVFIGQAA